jgi:hypothetical protein
LAIGAFEAAHLERLTAPVPVHPFPLTSPIIVPPVPLHELGHSKWPERPDAFDPIDRLDRPYASKRSKTAKRTAHLSASCHEVEMGLSLASRCRCPE